MKLIEWNKYFPYCEYNQIFAYIPWEREFISHLGFPLRLEWEPIDRVIQPTEHDLFPFVMPYYRIIKSSQSHPSHPVISYF